MFKLIYFTPLSNLFLANDHGEPAVHGQSKGSCMDDAWDFDRLARSSTHLLLLNARDALPCCQHP